MGAEEVLQRVADELEIRNLLARLAQLADGGDLDDYVSLFAEDAVWEGYGPARRGKADILAGATERRAAGGQGPGTHSYHIVSKGFGHELKDLCLSLKIIYNLKLCCTKRSQKERKVLPKHYARLIDAYRQLDNSQSY